MATTSRWTRSMPSRGCSPMRAGLQPYVSRAATLCICRTTVHPPPSPARSPRVAPRCPRRSRRPSCALRRHRRHLSCAREISPACPMRHRRRQQAESAALAAPQRTAPGIPGRALQAPGRATHSGRAAEPLRAQQGVAVRPRGPAKIADPAAFIPSGAGPPAADHDQAHGHLVQSPRRRPARATLSTQAAGDLEPARAQLDPGDPARG